MIKRLLTIILILLVAGLVWWLVRRVKGSAKRSSRQPVIEPMVSCAHCGLHIPRSEACWEGDTAFCSEAHRRAGARSSG